MQREWVVDLVQRLPQGVVSRGWGWLARRKHPRLGVTLLKRSFAKAAGIDMSEAEASMRSYRTLEDLFVRRLRPGARRIAPEPDAVVSPVDGTVGACGTVESDTMMQVKGRSYSLRRLLDDPEHAKRFEGGPYATLYLAPHNYHRIHSPVSGEIAEATVIPGALMPVFPEALEKVDELFARNERLISYVDSPDAGRVAVVKVGATLVGRIAVSYDDSLRTNKPGQSTRRVRYESPRLVNKGGELGVFELGSTVVLVGERGRIDFDQLVPGSAIQMGMRIGTVHARSKKAKKAKKAAGPRKRATKKRATKTTSSERAGKKSSKASESTDRPAST